MIGTETANSVQITWHIANDDIVCGIVTYHVMIIVTDDERLIKQDTTRNTIYTFDGLSPQTAYTIFVYGSNPAGNGETAVIKVRTPETESSKSLYVCTYYVCMHITYVCSRYV